MRDGEEAPVLGSTSVPPHSCTQKPTGEQWDLPLSATTGARGLAPSTAGWWATSFPRAGAAQGTRRLGMAGVTLRRAKEQQYRCFQLTQSIQTRETSAFLQKSILLAQVQHS